MIHCQEKRRKKDDKFKRCEVLEDRVRNRDKRLKHRMAERGCRDDGAGTGGIATVQRVAGRCGRKALSVQDVSDGDRRKGVYRRESASCGFGGRGTAEQCQTMPDFSEHIGKKDLKVV